MAFGLPHLIANGTLLIYLSAQAARPRIGAETGKLPRSFACGSQPQSAPLGFSANPGIVSFLPIELFSRFIIGQVETARLKPRFQNQFPNDKPAHYHQQINT